MKVVKLPVAPAREGDRVEVHAEAFGTSADGALTLVCGACSQTMVEGLDADQMLFDEVDLICQHCGAANDLASRLL